jgi:hypothetical protein
VFTSADHDRENIARAAAAATAGWVPKPYSPEQLLQTIKAA